MARVFPLRTESPMNGPDALSLAARIGLCAGCIHARPVPHPRGGAEYWRCARADSDSCFTKFPRLPVLECHGFVPQPKGESCGEGLKP